MCGIAGIISKERLDSHQIEGMLEKSIEDRIFGTTFSYLMIKCGLGMLDYQL